MYANNNPISFLDLLGLAPGDLQVNGQNIGNTRIIDDKTYGNLTDFIDALGGPIIDPNTKELYPGSKLYDLGDGEISVWFVDENKQSTNFKFNYTSLPFDKMQSINANVGSGAMNLVKVDLGNGNVKILAEMQGLVDINKGLVESLAYDLGTEGGTYTYYNSGFGWREAVKNIFVPTSLAKIAYDNRATFGNGLGTISPNDSMSEIGGSILGAILGQAYQDNQFNVQIKNGNLFIKISDYSFEGLFYKDSGYATSAYEDCTYDCSNYGVGLFYYGVYE